MATTSFTLQELNLAIMNLNSLYRVHDWDNNRDGIVAANLCRDVELVSSTDLNAVAAQFVKIMDVVGGDAIHVRTNSDDQLCHRPSTFFVMAHDLNLRRAVTAKVELARQQVKA